jgi:precorrin-6x reductase
MDDVSAQLIQEFEQRLATATEYSQRHARKFAQQSVAKAVEYLKLCEAGQRHRTSVLVDPHYSFQPPIG